MKQQFPAVSRTRLPARVGGLLVVGMVLMLSPVIACGSSVDEDRCTGEVRYLDTTYDAKGKDAEEAQRLACNKYCLYADPEFDAYYAIWLTSPKAAAAGYPPKTEAIYEDDDLLNYVIVTCANRCIADVKDGKLEGGATCP